MRMNTDEYQRGGYPAPYCIRVRPNPGFSVASPPELCLVRQMLQLPVCCYPSVLSTALMLAPCSAPTKLGSFGARPNRELEGTPLPSLWRRRQGGPRIRRRHEKGKRGKKRRLE
jgi:hypothetical protein